jgi:archaellum component FlaG (FlaF/FlaG flagellin family)
MKYCFLFFCSLLLAAVPAAAQTDSSFKLVRVMKGDIVHFAVDNLDNIYILNSRNQIRKYNANGDSVAIFNDVRKFGQVTYMDVSNPLKVLLYYKDFATVVMLDRFLNVRNTIDLRRSNILQVQAIGQSYDNKIWVYDELENKLKKIDEDGALLQETADFRLLLQQAPAPVRIFDENKYVYLYDTLKGVYVFDYFGTLKNNLLIRQWQNFKVTGKYIYGSRADSLYRYEIATLLTNQWKLPPELRNSSAFNFSSGRLYALRRECEERNNCIAVYSFR